VFRCGTAMEDELLWLTLLGGILTFVTRSAPLDGGEAPADELDPAHDSDAGEPRAR